VPAADWSRLAMEPGVCLSARWAEGKVTSQLGDAAQRDVQRMMRRLMLLQFQRQNINWGELIGSAMRLSGVTAPRVQQASLAVAVVGNLAYWLMRSIVAVERPARPNTVASGDSFGRWCRPGRTSMKCWTRYTP
jgi:hypothetical protein